VKTAFYDALHFVNDKLAYTFSDADKDSKLKLAKFDNGKWAMLKNDVVLNEGEAAFAASNTNISSTKNIYGLQQEESFKNFKIEF
jgi:hypothetical protein